MVDISRDVNQRVQASGIQVGLCHLFIRHTSASLVICENADPQVRLDLEAFMQRSVPDGDPNGYRAEFVKMVQRAKELRGE